MEEIREQLYQLSKTTDLRRHSLRSIGKELLPEREVHPETVKYYWKKLYKAGLIGYPPRETRKTGGSTASYSDRTKLGYRTSLVAVPVYGEADAGPATMLAEQRQMGKLHISSSLLPTKKYSSLYALRVSGNSMNRASVHGKNIEEGDYVIIDNDQRVPKNGDYVVTVVDNMANIKRFYRDNNRIMLLSESSEDYNPIFLHPEDQSDNLISGKVVDVIKNAEQRKSVL